MADDADTSAAQVSPQGELPEPAEPDTDPADDTAATDPDAGSAEIATDDHTDPDTESDVSAVAGSRAARFRWLTPLRGGLVVGLVAVVALGGVGGWLGYRAYQSQQEKNERELYLQVARQGALNLTTIDFEHADADIQRILDSATGQFYDDFAQRSEPFVEVVKQAQSKSEGKVTEAGLESVTGDKADAIVAVTVNTTNAGAPEQQPRSWRMRLTVERLGDDVKVSNVGFVP